MERSKIDRINELAKKSKTAEGLSDEEKKERQALRSEYLAAVRGNLRTQLDRLKMPDKK